MIKHALVALGCVAGLSTAALADADISVSAADGLTRSATVSIADLNLAQPQGKVALRSRLKKAVDAVCADDAACNYSAEREAARLASNAIASANGQLAMAPSSLTVSGAR